MSADSIDGQVTLDTMRLVQQESGVNLSLGASNMSYGLPDRKLLNVAYMVVGITCGLTAAITDPTVPEIRSMLLGSDLLMGRDEHARRWIRYYRTMQRARGEI